MVSIVLKNQEKMALVSDHHAMACLPQTWILGKDGYPRLEGLYGTRMHHFIWQLDNPGSTKGKVIDHINRDRLDNRIENLRSILPLENNWNRTLHEMSNIKKLKEGFRVSLVRGGQKLSTIASTLEEAIAIREAHRF